IVVGGAAGRARLLDRFKDRPIGARPGVECALVISRRRIWIFRHLIAVEGIPGVYSRDIADVEGFLDGRKRDFGRVFDLLGIVRHVQSEPSCYFYASRRLSRERLRTPEADLMPHAGRETATLPSACPPRLETSYWLSGANEMAAINTILIIVNCPAP